MSERLSKRKKDRERERERDCMCVCVSVSLITKRAPNELIFESIFSLFKLALNPSDVQMSLWVTLKNEVQESLEKCLKESKYASGSKKE